MSSLREEIQKMVRCGRDIPYILDQVNRLAVEHALVLCRGNQTEAARMLHMHRGTLRKYLQKTDTARVGSHSMRSGV